MILIGIDDTDTPDSPGTNQVARRIASAMPEGCLVELVVRHQLLLDRRIPFTSHNGAASLRVHCVEGDSSATDLIPALRAILRDSFVEGSDPGLCVADRVGPEIADFGRRCQRDVVSRREATDLASRNGIHLEGLGGTDDGVIGALAAVGLLSTGDDGRVVHMPGWPWPDPFGGPQRIADILDRGVERVLEQSTGKPVGTGLVELGKRLRPALRNGRVVLFVSRAADGTWSGLKLD